MYKNYILAFLGFAAGLAMVIFFTCFYNQDRPEEDFEITCVFNKATIGDKLAGKTFNDISRQYMPATSVTAPKGKKVPAGNFQARYENVKVFSKGSKDVVHGLTMEFKDSVVTKISLDEAKPSKDARWVNLSPLSYKFIDWEWGTRIKELKENEKAKGWQIPLLLLLGLLLLLLPFLFLWPLGVWLVRSMEGLGIVLYFLVTLLVLWLYDGFIAYSNGSTIVFVVVQAVALLITLNSMSKAIRGASAPTYSQSGMSGSSSNGRCSKSEYIGHLCNLAFLMASYGPDNKQDPASEKRARVVVDSMSRYGIKLSTDEFQSCMSHPRDTNNVSVPSNPAIRAEFVEDFFRLLASDETIPITAIKLAVVKIFADKLGESMELPDIMKRVVEVAKNEFGYTFTGDNFSF